MNTKEIREYLGTPSKPNLRYFPFQVAADLSDLAAVLLYDIHRRISTRKKPIIKDGFSWTYDTLETFAAAHTYASESGVRKAFVALSSAGLIRIEKTGKFNKRKFDGKWWYALTSDGRKRAALRRMRFHPDVAASEDIAKGDAILGIPTAVILEHFRHKLHGQVDDEFVTIKASKLAVPYHERTISRHLDKTVANGILERDPDDEDRYRVTSKAPAPQEDMSWCVRARAADKQSGRSSCWNILPPCMD